MHVYVFLLSGLLLKIASCHVMINYCGCAIQIVAMATWSINLQFCKFLPATKNLQIRLCKSGEKAVIAVSHL